MNLLKETQSIIMEELHKPKDIIFIGSEESGHSCSWEQFTELANIEYDNGYGSQKIAKDLIIVFNNGAKMRRDEYDGAEGWVYDKPFKMPEELKAIKSLGGDECMWVRLEEIQEKE